MTMDLTPGLLTVSFADDPSNISRIEYVDTNTRRTLCQVISADGTVINRFETVCERVFNQQYGTPVSPDGERLYIGVWTRGLFCYSVSTGKVLWRIGPGRVRHILVHGDFVIFCSAGRGIYKVEGKTGTLVKRIPFSGLDVLSSMSPNELFVGTKRDWYIIYSLPELEENARIRAAWLHALCGGAYILLSAKRCGDELVLEGWRASQERSGQGSEQFNCSIPLALLA